MKGKIFIDSSYLINWIPENLTGDVEGTRLAMDVMQGLIDDQGPSSILVDLSKGQRPNTLQRQLIVDALKSNRERIKKIAIFGESPLMKAIAYFVINASGYREIKFFSNRSQALQWLRQEA